MLPSRHRTNPHASGVDDAAQSLAFKTPHSQWSTPFKHRWVTSHERRSDVLCNNMYDFRREILRQIQTVRSHEVQILQLCDILLGAVSYANRDLHTSRAKERLVERIRQRSGYNLRHTTLYGESKFNLFVWRPSEARA